jgi:hypothetical protein
VKRPYLRPWIAALLAALTSPSALTAHAASPLRIEQSAPLPCAAACPYWEVSSAAGYDVCANPFPRGSFDETVMRITSTEGVVEIGAYPFIDYDTFLCTNTQPRVLIHSLAHYREECGAHFGFYWPLGCSEHQALTWGGLQAANGRTGDQFVILSYNWSDTASLLVSVSGPAEIVDDSYEARIA